MKTTRRILALVIAMVIAVAMATTAFAAPAANTNTDKDSGKNGPGTLTITGANAGQTYELYRIFEAVVNETDNTKVSYKPLAGKTIPENTYFKVENGYIIVQEEAKTIVDSKEVLSSGAVAWLTANYAAIGEKVTDVTTTTTGDQTVTGLPYGYYYVTTTTGTAVSVDTTNKDASVTDKNPGTSINKTITGVDGSVNTDKDKALAQVGTTVDFEVRIPIAKNAKSYKFTDVMSDGLTYKANSMKVYIVTTGVAVAQDETTATEYGTLTEAAGAAENDPDVTIVFNDTMLAANNEKDIVLHYQATVNKDAVIAGEGNKNTATIHWGHETDTLTDTGSATVYSAQITVKKIDGDGQALDGAGFKLKDKTANKWYSKDTDGIVSWVAKETDGTEIKPEKNGGDEAVASFTGLKDGTYTLVETTVPAGYNKAADVDVTIKDAASIDFTTELTIVSTVTNQKGTELPTTGGIGTTIFYVVGGLLAFGALVLLITKRRMNGKD